MEIIHSQANWSASDLSFNSTIQPFNHSTIQPLTIQPFNHPTI